MENYGFHIRSPFMTSFPWRGGTLISNCQSLFRINSSHPHVNRWNTRLWRIFILSRFATRLCGIYILSRLAHNNKGCLLTRLQLNYQDVIYTLLLLVPIIWSPIYRESAMYSTPAYFRCQASNNARYVCFVTILCGGSLDTNTHPLPARSKYSFELWNSFLSNLEIIFPLGHRQVLVKSDFKHF